MNNPDYSISTPENVDLHLELAGMGNRVLACMIDTIITYAMMGGIGVLCWLSVVVIGMANLPSEANSIALGFICLAAILVCFVVMFGYYIFFEGMWQGQTPGKKIAQIRVIDQNGQPVNWPSVFLRNIVRVFDMGVFFIGMIAMIIDKNERRLGDLAAGTLVIRERMPDLSTKDIIVAPSAKEGATTLDVGRVSPQEYDVLVSFLKRRQTMTRAQRPLVAKQLENHFRSKLSEPGSSLDNPEVFLERVYCAYQSRAD
ncbi:MAG TPA: RDD family protein [Trichormus sp.]|jgi:uncharacterized RDD family membrane protein YckC